MRLLTFLKLDVGYLRNIGFKVEATFFAQVINIVSLPIITRLFDPADIGVFNLFMQFMALATILISLRVEHVVMLPKTDDHARELVGFVVGFGIIVMCRHDSSPGGSFSGGIDPGDISLLGVDPAIGFFSGCVCASSAAIVPTLYGFSAKRHVRNCQSGRK